MENAQRSRLLQGTASLHRGSDSIARSHQVAAETDQIADEVVGELGTQRQSLLRTQERVFFYAFFLHIVICYEVHMPLHALVIVFTEQST